MLAVSIIILLLSNAVSSRRDKSILFSRVTGILLYMSFLISICGFHIKFQDKGLGLFGGLYHDSVISHAFQIFVLMITFLIIQLNSFYPRKALMDNHGSILSTFFVKLITINFNVFNKMSQQYRIIEYPLIILFIVMGGTFLMSSCDFISVFLSIELQSYGLYILCAIYRDSERATSGALTYFLLGGLSSCFILLGSSLFYGNSGNTSFDGLYIVNDISGADENLTGSFVKTILYIYSHHYVYFSLTVLAVGFLFKISAAPFHFWSPDVYDSIPTIVTTFVAVFAKISILVLLFELAHYTSNLFISNKDFQLLSEGYSNISWTFTFLISSLLSLVIGAVLGLTQLRIKRLYAYSTISHLGFILLALTINSVESIQSFIFYLAQYSLSNLNAFVLLIAISYTLYLYVDKRKFSDDVNLNNQDKSIVNEDKFDKKNSPIQLISDIKGFFFINPLLALSLVITLFSFVGVPPLIGFFAKQMVLTSALDNGYTFMALIAILTSVISAVYYLVLVKQIFFNDTDYMLNPELTYISARVYNNDTASSNKTYQSVNINVHLNSSIAIIISILTFIILLFMFSPQEWLNITTILSLIVFNC